jgi:hypothetical protein
VGQLPRRLVLLATVASPDVEPQVVSPGLGDEVRPRPEPLDLVELVLDQPVRRLHVLLPGVRPRRATRVRETPVCFNCLRELAVTLGLPVPNELAPVVGLEA